MIENFICVGENIHCTRVYKTDGKFVADMGNGAYAIPFKSGGKPGHLPIPKCFLEGADWQAGKVKHCAVALWQSVHGDAAGKQAGMEYVRCLARAQEAAGATFLDVNVDEFSTDVAERVKLMEWTVRLVEDASSIPVSVDSSNVEILRAGLKTCNAKRGAPLLNSVSLERPEAIAVAAETGAAVVASAAGERDLPCTTEERLANLSKLAPMLLAAGIPENCMHIDPLVFPISTDPGNGKGFLEAVTQVRKTFGPEVHIVAGLSNVSFGMPNRKLLNQVFARLAVEAGADGGIVDPLQINRAILNSLDTDSTPYRMARAVLTGEDEYGMEFIAASRDGTI